MAQGKYKSSLEKKLLSFLARGNNLPLLMKNAGSFCWNTEGCNNIYYIDTSVLLENMPLVKFIKTTSGTRVAYFP